MQVRRKLTLRELVNEARKGSAEAQSDLGYRYENGDGVKQSYQEAAKWYEKAFNQGYRRATAASTINKVVTTSHHVVIRTIFVLSEMPFIAEE